MFALMRLAALTQAGSARNEQAVSPRRLLELATVGGAPGRLQLVARHRTGASVYVDYAHKPEALETVLATLRPFARGRLVVVFGCGGDRDRGKRPVMGEIATRLAAAFAVVLLLLLLVVVLPASFTMGFSFPVVQKAVQQDLARLGSRVGFVQLANIVGNSAGSLVAGLLLLDLLGTAGTLRLLAAIGLAFAAIQLVGARGTRWAYVPAAVLAAESVMVSNTTRSTAGPVASTR